MTLGTSEATVRPVSPLAKILVFLLLSALPGCKRGAKGKVWYVDRITVVDGTLAGNTALSIQGDELKGELLKALDNSSRFVNLGDKESAPSSEVMPFHCRLEVAFTKESTNPGTPPLKAEVGVTLELKRIGPPARYEATGLGRFSFAPGDDAVRKKAFRNALDQALSQVVEAEIMQLSAEDKDDAALIVDLNDKDARVRDYAVRTLSERKNKAAVPTLIARLSDPSREVALRAIGALRIIGDPKAVPPLIELTRNKDSQFLMTVIDVVGGIGGDEANAWLFTLASGHPDEQVRQAAQEAQDAIAKDGKTASRPQNERPE